MCFTESVHALPDRAKSLGQQLLLPTTLLADMGMQARAQVYAKSYGCFLSAPVITQKQRNIVGSVRRACGLVLCRNLPFALSIRTHICWRICAIGAKITLIHTGGTWFDSECSCAFLPRLEQALHVLLRSRLGVVKVGATLKTASASPQTRELTQERGFVMN